MAKTGRKRIRYEAGWLKDYEKLTSDQESPRVFHQWCGLFALSCALGRRVFLDRGVYILYPNLYVMLVAESGKYKKSTAIEIIESMVRRALPGMPLIAQKVTPEALLLELHRRRNSCGRSEAIIAAEELGVFLGGKATNLSLVQLLTKLYNCKDTLDYRTVTHGLITAKNTWCAIIAGTTPAWLREALTDTSVEGGFTSRFIFIYGKGKVKRRAFPTMDRELQEILTDKLMEIGMLQGAYILSDQAKKIFASWYEEEPSKEAMLLPGYYSRKHDTGLKIAMLLSASRDGDMIIDGEDLIRAREILESIESHLIDTFKAIQTTPDGVDNKNILNFIVSAGERGVTFAEIARKLNYKYSFESIKKVVSGLREAELVIRMPKAKAPPRFYATCVKGGGGSKIEPTKEAPSVEAEEQGRSSPSQYPSGIESNQAGDEQQNEESFS